MTGFDKKIYFDHVRQLVFNGSMSQDRLTVRILFCGNGVSDLGTKVTVGS